VYIVNNSIQISTEKEESERRFQEIQARRAQIRDHERERSLQKVEQLKRKEQEVANQTKPITCMYQVTHPPLIDNNR
jgi:hypothetical protein